MRKAIKLLDKLYRLAFLPKGKHLPPEMAWRDLTKEAILLIIADLRQEILQISINR